MSSIFQELKRRNVFRVGVTYIVIAWLIIQVIETVSDPLSLPEWTEAFFIVALLAGLPLVLLFSWAFEITPDGLKKTEDVDADESVTATTGKKLNYTIIAVLVLSLGYFLWERQGLVEQAERTAAVGDDATEVTQTSSAASIAVLPFVNMSADPDQEYFSDGISEELLNLLAKIPNLHVPARTSSFQFKGQNVDISEVGKKLNVKHVLEGSVRKADVRIRVTAQLIEVDTGYHLWSESYDRELDDIFAIQDEISAAIVAALSEILGLQVDAAPKVTAAANPEAYNAFLLAQYQIKKRTNPDIKASIVSYERALEHDPDYAPTHAGLGLAWYLLTASSGTYGDLTLEESLSKGLPHIERALELDPNLPEALGNMGLILSARYQQEEAIPYFEKALALNPSLTDIRNWYASSLGDLGKIEESLREMEKAYEIDPLSVLTLNNYSNELLIRRQFDKLGPVLDRLSQIDPVRGALWKGSVFVTQGRAADGVEQWMRGVDLDTSNFRSRSQAATGLWNLGLHDAGVAIWPRPDNLYDLVSGSTDFDYILELAQQEFNDDPNNPQALSNLAWAQWDAGNKDEGIKLAERHLRSIGDTQRPVDSVNFMFVLDAWHRGDKELILERIGPLEAFVDEALDSGIDFFFLHLLKAVIAQIHDQPDVAIGHLSKAATRSIMPVDRLTYMYEIAGWDEMPEFADLRNTHREYMSAERDKLLKVACGPDGFEVWQPSSAACGKSPASN
ncbi:MAG: tetratricopeptide repeat protein [Proteobacteria bacterium]|nr:tetratricopeptide repeat protein [Pseudomonadota bacterium]